MTPTCHPERQHAARGLCSTCYRRRRRVMDPETDRRYREGAKHRPTGPCPVDHCIAQREPTKAMCSMHTMRRRQELGDCIAWGCRSVPRRDGFCLGHAPVSIPLADCRRCGGRWVRRDPGVVCIECRQLYHKERARLTSRDKARSRATPTSEATCHHCGRPYPSRSVREDGRWVSRGAYCSDGCMRRAGKRLRRDRERTNGSRPIHRGRIYQRDGWLCGICGGPVERGLLVPSPGAPTLDHIVPLAHGGRHIESNVQLAHFICNTRKGAGGTKKIDAA